MKKDAKNDLNSLIDEMRTTVHELKQPSTKMEQLRINQEKYAQVRSRQALLEARINPIKLKFAFLQDDSNSDSTVVELTEEEKLKLASLEDEWHKFLKGLVEANQIIVKNYGEHKLEQDNIMDDFKKEVTDNKDSFKKSAPFSVEKSQEFDNEKAMEKLQEFKMACVELR